MSAAMVPLIGIAGIFVGLYMKLNYPDINAAAALPLFILEKFLRSSLGQSLLPCLWQLWERGLGLRWA